MSTTPSVRRSTCTPERRGVVADAAASGSGAGVGPTAAGVAGAALDDGTGAATGIDDAVVVGTAPGDAGSEAPGSPPPVPPPGRPRPRRRGRAAATEAASRAACSSRIRVMSRCLSELALVHRGRHREELCGRGNPHVEPAHVAARRREGAEARRAPRGVDELGRIGGPASHVRARPLRGIGRSCAHSATRTPPSAGPSTAPVRGPALGSASGSQRAPCPCSRLSWVHPCCRMLRRARAGESTS